MSEDAPDELPPLPGSLHAIFGAPEEGVGPVEAPPIPEPPAPEPEPDSAPVARERTGRTWSLPNFRLPLPDLRLLVPAVVFLVSIVIVLALVAVLRQTPTTSSASVAPAAPVPAKPPVASSVPNAVSGPSTPTLSEDQNQATVTVTLSGVTGSGPFTGHAHVDITGDQTINFTLAPTGAGTFTGTFKVTAAVTEISSRTTLVVTPPGQTVDLAVDGSSAGSKKMLSSNLAWG